MNGFIKKNTLRMRIFNSNIPETNRNDINVSLTVKQNNKKQHFRVENMH